MRVPLFGRKNDVHSPNEEKRDLQCFAFQGPEL